MSGKQKELERIAQIDAILQHFDNRLGVYKRIDENPELMELIQQQAPHLLNEFPWIECWINGNDRFFMALEACVNI